MDKYIQAIRFILQNIIGISAHDYARTFVSQLQNYIALNVPKEICCGQTVHYAGHALGGEGIRQDAFAGGVLTMLLDKLGGKTGFQSNLFYQFLIVEGDAKLVGDCATDAASAAAKFTANGNDFLFHINASL